MYVTLCLLLVSGVQAQEKTKVRELGFTASNLDQFGITYRVGHEKAVWRFNTMLLDLTIRDDDANGLVTTGTTIRGSFSVGREWRKSLADKLELRYGADISLLAGYAETEMDSPNIGITTSESTEITPGLNAVIGFNYLITDRFLVGAEFLPGFRYIISETTSENGGIESTTERNLFDFGFDNNAARLSLVYRF